MCERGGSGDGNAWATRGGSVNNTSTGTGGAYEKRSMRGEPEAWKEVETAKSREEGIAAAAGQLAATEEDARNDAGAGGGDTARGA